MTKAQEKLNELMEEFDNNKLYVTRCIKHSYREAVLQGLESSRVDFWEDVIDELNKLKVL